jgi:hypothetical protein
VWRREGEERPAADGGIDPRRHARKGGELVSGHRIETATRQQHRHLASPPAPPLPLRPPARSTLAGVLQLMQRRFYVCGCGEMEQSGRGLEQPCCQRHLFRV